MTLRRQLSLAIAAGIAILALLVGGAVWALRGGGRDQAAAPGPTQQGEPGAGGEPILGQVQLESLPGEDGEGKALLAEQAGQPAVVVQAKGIEGVGADELLEVWFYNSREEARSIGAQRVQGGSFQGLGALPPDWQRYRFVDLSRERADRNPEHSGDSVLRGDLPAARAGPPPQGAP